MSLEDWLASRPQRPDPALARIDAALLELATIVGGEASAAFEARATTALEDTEAGRRALLSDSLVLEAGALVAAHRAVAARRNRFEAAHFSLEGMRLSVPRKS